MWDPRGRRLRAAGPADRGSDRVAAVVVVVVQTPATGRPLRPDAVLAVRRVLLEGAAGDGLADDAVDPLAREYRLTPPAADEAGGGGHDHDHGGDAV